MRIYNNLYAQSLFLFKVNGPKFASSSFLRLCNFSSGNQNHSIDSNIKEDNYDASYNVHPQLKEKLPQREPFVKNLFMGKFDNELLEFPETLIMERQELFHRILSPVENFFENEVDSAKIDKEAKINPTTMQALRDLGLFGMEVPLEYGGLALSETEKSRLYEVIGLDSSINLTLGAHQALGLKAILLYGTEAQKVKYLPKLASGEYIAAFALSESNSGSDSVSIEMSSVLTDNQKSYVLNGEKVWVSNGASADIFVVFSKIHTSETNIESDAVDKKIKPNFGAFIVERNFGGVTSDEPLKKMGLRGANVTTVKFDNTSVPVENVLCNDGGGLKIAMNVIGSTGCSTGSACVGSLKKLMKETVKYAENRKPFEKCLSEYTLVRKKIGQMAIDIYALESMVYFTAGLEDLLEKQDTTVESAIIKVFSSEKMFSHSSQCLKMMGTGGLESGSLHERHFRDSRALMLMNGTNEISKLFIALSCLQHVGGHVAEKIKKLRNRFYFPSFILKENYNDYRVLKGKAKLDLYIKDNLYIGLSGPADSVEHAIKKLELNVTSLLKIEGSNVSEPDQQLRLERLADVAINLYAMIAVLSRSSRSKSIGLPDCDHEVRMASFYCYQAKQKIEKLLADVMVTDLEHEPDKVLEKIMGRLVDKKGYAAVHPMERVFW